MKNPWTIAEVSKVKEYLKSKNFREIGEILNRSTASVVAISNYYNLPKLFDTVSKWTAKETALLIELYATTKNKDLVAVLPNKTEEQIQSKATHLKIKKNYDYKRTCGKSPQN